MKRISQLLCTAALAVSVPALASPIVFDNSPQATGASVITDLYSNIYNSQYFAGKFSLADAFSLDGIDIYSGSGFGSVGSAVMVTIWTNNAGLPGSIAAQFATTIDAIDNNGAAGGDVRKHADFTGFDAQAGTTYWIGMAGNGVEIAQTGLSYAGSDRMAVLNGSGYLGAMSGTQMAFRVYGDSAAAAVPEPASLAIFGLGLAGMAALRRKRRA